MKSVTTFLMIFSSDPFAHCGLEVEVFSILNLLAIEGGITLTLAPVSGRASTSAWRPSVSTRVMSTNLSGLIVLSTFLPCFCLSVWTCATEVLATSLSCWGELASSLALTSSMEEKLRSAELVSFIEFGPRFTDVDLPLRFGLDCCLEFSFVDLHTLP